MCRRKAVIARGDTCAAPSATPLRQALDLSRASGVTRKAIREIERAARPTKLTTLARLATALGLTLEDLLDHPPGVGRKTVQLLRVAQQ